MQLTPSRVGLATRRPVAAASVPLLRPVKAVQHGPVVACSDSHHMLRPRLGVHTRVAYTEQEVVTTNTAEEQPQNGQHYEPFPWTKCWYPIATTDELDPTRPHQITLLGEDYVLWRDATGSWRVFADRCPHRMVPLSEGRVEKDGTLLCAYHAWRFDGTGTCTHMPQVDAEQEQQLRSNPRACATAYPTKEEDGLIWMWPEAGAMAELESCAKAPYQEVIDPSLNATKKEWRSHDLPYGLDFFLENVLDPAHVPVSHHNIMGSRYKDAKPVTVTVLDQLERLTGFKCSTGQNSNGTKGTVSFHPPHTVRIQSTNPDGGYGVIQLHAIPTTPGYCRMIGRQIFVSGASGKAPKGIGFFGVVPVWLSHLMAPAFLHQDAVFLHHQERLLSRKQFQGKTYKDVCYMPITSDKMVILMRAWFERFSPKGIPFAGAYEGQPMPLPERNREKLFDTWNTHSKNCKICLTALDNMRKARIVAFCTAVLAAIQVAVVTASAASANAAALVSAGAAAGAAVTHASYSLPPLAAFLWAGAAVLALGAGVVLNKMISLYHTWPFSHADNN